MMNQKIEEGKKGKHQELFEEEKDANYVYQIDESFESF